METQTAINLRLLKRHDLVEITKTGRYGAVKSYLDRFGDAPEAPVMTTLIAQKYGGAWLPGIIRRQEGKTRDGLVPIGFSSPFIKKGRRLRGATFIHEKEIETVTSPYQVLKSHKSVRTGCLAALHAIKDFGQKAGLEVGVWGSAALEIHTGQPYTHEGSDLDIVIKATRLATLFDFTKSVLAIGECHRLRVDIEIDLPSGFGVSIKEIMNGNALILGKGLKTVRLIPRTEVVALCQKQ